MEILAETTHWGGFLFGLGVFGVSALLMLVCVIAFIVDGCNNKSEVVGAIVASTLFILLTTLLGFGIKEGPDVTYKALITDFNEVYEQGYEIVDQDGKLYTIRESEAD